MTQTSRPQGGKYTDGYHDAGGYTSEQWARIFSILLTLNEQTEGVVKHLSDLAVTNPSGTVIRVASGAALVRGRLFINEDQSNPANSSNVDFTVDPPATGSRTDRVVLVQNNTDYDYDGTPDYGAAVLQIPDDTSDYEYGTSFVAASGIPPHTCRLALLLGNESSGGAMRALTQDASLIAGDIWMLELARYTINSAGAITLTDMRDYAPKFTTENLASNAVTSGKIASNAVTSGKIANNAVTSDKIANNAVTSDKIAGSAVTSDKIADNAVTSDKIASNAVTPAKIANRTREVFFPAAPETFSAAGTVADLRGVSLLRNATVSATCYGMVPLDFVSNPKLVAVLCKPASATAPDAKAYMQGYYSLASDGDTFAPPSPIPPFLVSETTLNTIYYQDLDFSSIPTPGDSLSVSITRIFDHPSDTSDQNFYIRGVIFRYTADS